MSPIEVYLGRIRQTVEHLPNAAIEFYLEQLLSPTRANLRFRVHWPSGALLEVSEAIALSVDSLLWLSYRYHFQDAQHLLRYDNAPHHPHLSTHPEHRHQATELTESPRPDLEVFLQEINELTGLW